MKHFFISAILISSLFRFSSSSAISPEEPEETVLHSQNSSPTGSQTNTTEPSPTLNGLPELCIASILHHLTPAEAGNISKTSRSTRSTVEDAAQINFHHYLSKILGSHSQLLDGQILNTLFTDSQINFFHETTPVKSEMIGLTRPDFTKALKGLSVAITKRGSELFKAMKAISSQGISPFRHYTIFELIGDELFGADGDFKLKVGLVHALNSNSFFVHQDKVTDIRSIFADAKETLRHLLTSVYNSETADHIVVNQETLASNLPSYEALFSEFPEKTLVLDVSGAAEHQSAGNDVELQLEPSHLPPSVRKLVLSNIRQNVTSFGHDFLSRCNVTTIEFCVFPKVTRIKHRFLSPNDNLTTVDLNLPEATSFGDAFISGCPNLQSVNLSVCSNIVDVGEHFFSYTGLPFVDLPFSRLSTLRNYFLSYTELTSFDFNSLSGVTNIGDDFFSHSSTLPSADLRAFSRVSHIGNHFFALCPKLTFADLSTLSANIHTGDDFFSDSPLTIADL